MGSNGDLQPWKSHVNEGCFPVSESGFRIHAQSLHAPFAKFSYKFLVYVPKYAF